MLKSAGRICVPRRASRSLSSGNSSMWLDGVVADVGNTTTHRQRQTKPTKTNTASHHSERRLGDRVVVLVRVIRVHLQEIQEFQMRHINRGVILSLP
jgi:hypothetical protein